MTTCRLCGTDDKDAFHLWTPKHGETVICIGCLRDLVDEKLDELEDAQERHCAGCANSQGDGCRYPGVTWENCA